MALKHSMLVLTLCLIGCSSVPAAPVETPTHLPRVSVPLDTDILGRWDVVSFEEYQPASRHGAYANFWRHGLSVRLDCNHSRIPAVVRHGRLVTQPGPISATEMGCGAEVEARDSRYFSFFKRSPSVERLPNGRLRMVAGDSILILERPEQRRLAFLPTPGELNGRWRMESLTRYGPEDGESGIGLSDVPGRIVIQENRLSYDRCPQFALTFTYGANGRLVKAGGAGLPEDADCPPLNAPRETFDMPTPDQILALLHGNPWVEEIGNGRMLIANEELGLVVAKEP